MCGYDDMKKKTTSKSCNLSYGNSNTTVQSDKSFRVATASYYTNVPSVSVDSIKELVRFFHEVWNNASIELMCLNVKHKLVLNLPETLTEKSIRKYHPNCQSCATGNLQQRPFLSIPLERDIKIGEEWEIDALGPMTDEKKKKCPAFLPSFMLLHART